MKMEGLQEGRQEGLQQGLQKGRQEGRQEGRIWSVNLQLKLKFRPQYEAYLQYLPQLTIEQLDLIAERILFEDRIEKVFEGLI